jgi:hypothetical protein
VGETRDWFGVYSGGKEREIGMREGGDALNEAKGFTRTVGGGVGAYFLSFCL